MLSDEQALNLKRGDRVYGKAYVTSTGGVTVPIYTVTDPIVNGDDGRAIDDFGSTYYLPRGGWLNRADAIREAIGFAEDDLERACATVRQLANDLVNLRHALAT